MWMTLDPMGDKSKLIEAVAWCLSGNKPSPEPKLITVFEAICYRLATMHYMNLLTHWGQVTHICVHNLTIIGSDNELPSGWHQAIIWTNFGILSIGLLGTNFSEILIKIHSFSFKKMYLKMLSGKWQPSCLSSICLSVGHTHLHTHTMQSCCSMLIFYKVQCDAVITQSIFS